jgi:hypothetical protein
MSSLPTTEREPYTVERSNNDAKIAQIFAQLFPETPVPYEYIFDVVRLLESTKVNARILPEVIRGIYNLRTSDRRGQVIIHVQSELTNVQIRENSETMKTLMDDEDEGR